MIIVFSYFPHEKNITPLGSWGFSVWPEPGQPIKDLERFASEMKAQPGAGDSAVHGRTVFFFRFCSFFKNLGWKYLWLPLQTRFRFHGSIQFSLSTSASLWPWVLGFSTVTATIHKIRYLLCVQHVAYLYVSPIRMRLWVGIFNSMSLVDMNLVRVGRMREINIFKNLFIIHVYLRKIQQTPRAYPFPFEYVFWKDSFHFGCWRDLVYRREHVFKINRREHVFIFKITYKIHRREHVFKLAGVFQDSIAIPSSNVHLRF